MASSWKSIGLLVCGALAACTELQEGTKQATQGAAENYEMTKASFKNMFTYRPPNKTPKPVPPSYCYRVMQDITCYREAIPGAAGRLVAYQGSVVEDGPVAPEIKQFSTETPTHQAEAAPVAAVSAADTPGATSGLKNITPLTQTEGQKEKTEQSMAHFDKTKPVEVGAPPSVAEMPFGKPSAPLTDEEKPEAKSEAKPEPKAEPKAEAAPEAKPEAKDEPKPAAEPKAEPKTEAAPKAEADPKT